MGVRIFQPAKNAMQSGLGATRKWVLEFEPAGDRVADPLMGWTGGGRTTDQLRLTFASREEAVAYAERKGLDYTVLPPKKRRHSPKSYAANFAYDRIN